MVKAGAKTCYVYGADGARLKKVSGLTASQSCTALPITANQTVYFGPIEIENFKLVGDEKVVAFPHPDVKLVNGAAAANANYLHRDHLGSVRAITDNTGAREEATVYKPYGERTPTINLTLAPEDREDKGWIGERFDPETGLQYLNARTYDPELGLFLQPDWWEVTKAGVGTNRYAYSFGDPVNNMDPGGNQAAEGIVGLLAEWSYQRARSETDDINERAKLAKGHYNYVKDALGWDIRSILDDDIKSRPRTAMDPQDLTYSQKNHSKYLSNGETVDELAEKLKSGEVKPDDLPPVRVFEENGKIVTLDNRRVEAARRAGVLVSTVEAAQIEIDEETITKNARTRDIKERPNSTPRVRSSSPTPQSFWSNLGEMFHSHGRKRQ